ncbi:MAG: hypothetical protein MHPSP_003180, partial [Paramarteilia canceri]
MKESFQKLTSAISECLKDTSAVTVLEDEKKALISEIISQNMMEICFASFNSLPFE